MKIMVSLVVASGLALAGCGKADQSAESGAPQQAAAKPQAAIGGAGGGDNIATKVVVPQIAYTYSLGFDVPGDALAAIQDRHIALCDGLGPARCHVLVMERSSGADGGGPGTLKLVVRADLARGFEKSLGAVAAKDGGEQVDSSIAAEDLSKQIVDTEARLRAKQALAARLMELLRTRTGPVADLVAAERAVAEVQEEIDAAASWLAEARGRVSMSTIDVTYRPVGGAGGGFIAPLERSFETMSSVFGNSLALLIRLVAGLLPWAVVGLVVFLIVRRVRAAHIER